MTNDEARRHPPVIGEAVQRCGWLAGIALGLAACGQAAPPPAAPKGPTACARASDSMVGAMLSRLPAADPPPVEEADALRNLIRERCEHDGWSAEATRCLIAMTSIKDAEPCARLMTDEQQAALVRDEAAMFGAVDAQASPAATPASAPASSPSPGEPAKSEKPNP